MIKRKHCRENASMCVGTVEVLGQNLGCGCKRFTKQQHPELEKITLWEAPARPDTGNDIKPWSGRYGTLQFWFTFIVTSIHPSVFTSDLISEVNTDGWKCPLTSRHTHPHAADSFLPWSHSGQVDLVQGLVRELQVDALWCYGELERHSLVGLRHRYGNTGAQTCKHRRLL